MGPINENKIKKMGPTTKNGSSYFPSNYIVGTERRTDKAEYRVACTRLKIMKFSVNIDNM